ncbi:MAG: hypothetical protein R3C15_05715 [Thermoleophilia bacterium]
MPRPGATALVVCLLALAGAAAASAATGPAVDAPSAPALLVAGAFADGSLLALDATGRRLASGAGEGRALDVAVCPGGRRAAESIDRGDGSAAVAIRALPGLEAVRELPAPGAGPIACLDEAGDEVAVLGLVPGGSSSLVRIGADGTPATLWSGPAVAGTLTTTRAAITAGAEGDRLVVVDLATGSVRDLGELPAGAGPLAQGPGERLAGVRAPADDLSQALLVEPRGTGIRSRGSDLDQALATGRALWVTDRQFVVVTVNPLQDVRLYDVDLQRGEAFGGWNGAVAAAARGCLLYGIDREDGLRVAALPDGPVRNLGTLDGQVEALVAVDPPAPSDLALGCAEQLEAVAAGAPEDRGLGTGLTILVGVAVFGLAILAGIAGRRAARRW